MLRLLNSGALRRLQSIRGPCLRGYADAAPPAKASPPGAVAEQKDWEDYMDGLIKGDDARRELASLKTAIANFTSKVQDRSKEVPAIPWDSYKGSVDNDILDSFKAAYTSLELPKMDDAEFIKSVDSKFEPLVKAAEEMTQHAKKRSAEISQQIKSLELEMAKLRTMTVDEAMALDPETATAVDKEISEGRYY